jgi:hypothetical protein
VERGYKNYTEMREEWNNRQHGFWLPLKKYGVFGRDEKFCVFFSSNNMV